MEKKQNMFRPKLSKYEGIKIRYMPWLVRKNEFG